MQQGRHLLDESAVQALSDAIQLWHVVDGESAGSTSISEVLIKHFAQVLPFMIRTQHLYGATVVLGACPRLKLVVGREHVTLCREEIGERKPCSIVREGDEKSMTMAGGHGSWLPHISMYLISELMGLFADPQLWDRLTGCTCEDAHLTVLFPRIQVEHEADD